MNQDKLKANKLSDRGLTTRKFLVSSQVPPRSLVIPIILLGLFLFFFYWFYSGLNQQQDNQSDGVFDFIEGITAKSSNGRIIFPE